MTDEKIDRVIEYVIDGEYDDQGKQKRFKSIADADQYLRDQIFSRWFKRECQSLPAKESVIIDFLKKNRNVIVFYLALHQNSGPELCSYKNAFIKSEQDIWGKEY